MAKVNRFEELECWQEARNFVKLIYELTKKTLSEKILNWLGKSKGVLFHQWPT